MILQVETTTRCTLKCPACARTIFAEKTNRPYPNTDLDADAAFRFLDCELGRKINHLVLVGDYGDCIYYPQLFYFLDLFRATKTFTLVTNGSYRDQEFWNGLCQRLDSRDTVRFSIDGLKENNHLYRVNSDWDSTMLGIDTVVKAGINVEWETNIFSFNYDKLETIKQFAESKGAKFRAKYTARFGREDLKPPVQYIKVDELYNSTYSKPGEAIAIDPSCKNLGRNSICADNHYYPCGYIRYPLVLYKSRLWAEREQWSIMTQTLDDLQKNVLDPWVAGIQSDPANADVICKMRCRPGQSQLEVFDL